MDYSTVIHDNYLFHTVPGTRRLAYTAFSRASSYWLWTLYSRDTPVYIYDSKGPGPAARFSSLR